MRELAEQFGSVAIRPLLWGSQDNIGTTVSKGPRRSLHAVAREREREIDCHQCQVGVSCVRSVMFALQSCSCVSQYWRQWHHLCLAACSYEDMDDVLHLCHEVVDNGISNVLYGMHVPSAIRIGDWCSLCGLRPVVSSSCTHMSSILCKLDLHGGMQHASALWPSLHNREVPQASHMPEARMRFPIRERQRHAARLRPPLAPCAGATCCAGTLGRSRPGDCAPRSCIHA